MSNVFQPNNSMILFICAFALLAPVLTIEIFCSLSIVRILRRPGPGKKEAQEKKEGNQQKKRAAKIMCIVLVMLVFNVVPFILVPLVNGVSQAHLLTVVFTLSTVGTSVQAFLFLSRAGKLPCRSKG